MLKKITCLKPLARGRLAECATNLGPTLAARTDNYRDRPVLSLSSSGLGS